MCAKDVEKNGKLIMTKEVSIDKKVTVTWVQDMLSTDAWKTIVDLNGTYTNRPKGSKYITGLSKNNNK